MQLKRSSIFLMMFVLIGLGACQQTQDTDPQSDNSPTESPKMMVTKAVVAEPTVVIAPENVDDDQAADDWVLADYRIVSEESSARFELDETLKSSETGWRDGTRVTVVGTTDQVSGSFSFSPSALNAAQLDEIRIDANTFSTDNMVRTLAVRRTVLESVAYPAITFSPTGVRDLPETVEIGEEVVFNLDGDLTIRDVTLAQSFVVSATLVSPGRVEGTAATTVTRESYELDIVVALHVTDVEDEVELYIDFVALSE
ncbi:MAG: YceI family protein [Candidatus Promineifilaceae bacterium]